MAYQILVIKQPVNVKTTLWCVAIVGHNLDELNDAGVTPIDFSHELVTANNKQHAKRKLKKVVRRFAVDIYNALGRHVNVSACRCKDY